MSLGGILGIVLLSRTPTDGTRYEVMVGSYGPRSEMRYSRPTLKWEIWPMNPTDKFKGIEMRVDGKAVPAVYDAGQRALLYTPDKPLSPGTHRVECHVYMGKAGRFDQTWESRISADAVSDLPAPLASQVESIKAINLLRRTLGLPPAIADDRMNAAALQHSRYLSRNKEFGHDENPSKPGYTGATTSDRLGVYGWIGGCWEDVSFGTQPPTEAVNGLFDAPYHRIPFLQPGSILCGAGYIDQRLTLDFGMSGLEDTIVSPADGQKDVPTTWRNFERPDPLRMHRQSNGTTGYPIVLAKFGARNSKLGKVTKAKLYDSDGNQVPCWLNTPDDDENLTGAAILIPQNPLRPKTLYQYAFAVKDADGKSTSSSGIFTTGQ